MPDPSTTRPISSPPLGKRRAVGRSSTACGGHPRWFAAAFSVLGAVAAGSPQVVLEGYGPPLAVFLVAAACSLFAFVVLVGPYLRLVGRGGTQRPAASLAVPLSATRSCVVAPIARATCARVVETAQKHRSAASDADLGGSRASG